MQSKKTTVGRRDFLRTLGVGAGAAAVAAAPLVGEARADSESGSDRTKARYKETEHVKAFYKVNRYPPSKK
jgi:hypothetical protein